MERFLDLIPELYSGLVPDWFEAEAPSESLATCDNCIMTTNCRTNRGSHSHLFNPNIKCCTFFPTLPNYLLGAILSDEEMSYAHHQLERLFQKGLMDQKGLSPDETYIQKFHVEPSSFGTNEDFLCPFYVKEGGLCGIWKFRNSSCLTYFCKHIGGQRGLQFWEALRFYLFQVEAGLATELSTDSQGFNSFESAAVFYKQSFEALLENKVKFKELLPTESSLELTNLRESYDALIQIPERLMVNADYSSSETIQIKQVGVDLNLPLIVRQTFDGSKSTNEAISYLQNQHDLEIDLELLILLIRYKVLVEV